MGMKRELYQVLAFFERKAKKKGKIGKKCELKKFAFFLYKDNEKRYNGGD